MTPPSRESILATLRAHHENLRAQGVKSLTLFGSFARDEPTPESDIDLMVEFDQPVGFFRFCDVQEYLQEILDWPKIDLVTPEAIYPELEDDIYSEAIHVFKAS